MRKLWSACLLFRCVSVITAMSTLYPSRSAPRYSIACGFVMAAALSTYSVGGRSSLHSRCVTRRRTTSRRSRSPTRPADELLRRLQVVDRTGISPSQWRRALTCLPVRTLHSLQTDFFTYVHTCMHVILLVSSDSPTLIFFLLRLSAHHLALAVLALQPPKFETLSLHLSILVPVLIPSVVTSRPAIATRLSNPLNPFLLAPQIRLLLTIVCVYIYLLTYLLTLVLVHHTWKMSPHYLVQCRTFPPDQSFMIFCHTLDNFEKQLAILLSGNWNLRQPVSKELLKVAKYAK